MEKDIIIYNGGKFTRYPNAKGNTEKRYYSGWVGNPKKKKRLHVYKYENEIGEVPKGFHVHHIDGNTLNNEISNLQIIERSAHHKMHMADEKRKEQSRQALKNFAQPAACEWHKSQNGRKWHKELMQSRIAKAKTEIKCKECEKTFVGNVGVGFDSKFCCVQCKTRYGQRIYRSDKRYYVEKECVVCSKKYSVSKWVKTKCCNRSCGGKLREGLRLASRKQS